MRDGRWTLEISEETWQFHSLDDMKYELDSLFNKKIKFGRIKNEKF